MENKMNANNESAMDTKVKLSTLWIFILFNMVFAVILSFLDAELLNELLMGRAGDVEITSGFLLLAAIFLEIPIAMVFLSRVMPYKINRWANIIAAVVTIAFVIGGGSTMPHYLFIAAIEVAA